MALVYRNKMIVAITSIELKSPFKIFAFLIFNQNIVHQLKSHNCIEFKKKGSWIKYYTMTLWRNKDDIKRFVHNEAHKHAIGKSKTIAKEIKTLTIEAYTLPNWKEAIILLKIKGKSHV
ncbi:DUF3291 domain-containing protein [Flavobacteriaceae bacterium 3-367]